MVVSMTSSKLNKVMNASPNNSMWLNISGSTALEDLRGGGKVSWSTSGRVRIRTPTSGSSSTELNVRGVIQDRGYA